MPEFHDGPASELFWPLPLRGNTTFARLGSRGVSENMAREAGSALTGSCTCWGIPFEVGKPVLLDEKAYAQDFEPFKAPWLVFMHTTDVEALEWNEHGFISPTRGVGRLRETVAEYVIRYADGSEARQPILRRHHIHMFQRGWGENGFECVAHQKPHPIHPTHEQVTYPPGSGGPGTSWGWTQTRVSIRDMGPWVNWLWAWENPHPEKKIVGLRFEPKAGTVVISAVSAGKASVQPLRWRTRRKAVLRLPKGVAYDLRFDEVGQSRHIRLDLGVVISVEPRPGYSNDEWAESYNNKLPVLSTDEVIVEYSAHPDAVFRLEGGATVPVARAEAGRAKGITPVAPATRRVRLRVVEKGSDKPVAVKLHVHGEAGEYLAPVDRHRNANWAWYEDYAPEFSHKAIHRCTYIDGETVLDLPLGHVYIEVSKGFEIRPVRKVIKVTGKTDEVTVALDRVLPWRRRGWVTADTHVHFLSPMTARLEGAAEGVNVINLLASQWGELMTNAGDFDGELTHGSKEAGGDGEWLVRVGTENRQHVMGHISLLGYNGRIIAPMTVGGPDEAAIGDPVDILLIEWARQCKAQGGLVVLPHFPNPRAEHAAAVVEGEIDAIEMTSWDNLYLGIDPYSLSDWYRYLNCGYFVPAVGGTDKMAATTAVGTVRTYARLPRGKEFTYAAWMEAIRRGHTFVTYGPLLEFSVEGKPAGTWIDLKATGGTVAVEWEVASVTTPISRVELVVNGEIRQSKAVRGREASGSWNVKLDKSSWLALLVRGNYLDKPEIIAAHSSPVMVRVAGSPFFAAADAVTILEQIEGAIAYLDTVGTRAEDQRYKEMRLTLTSAYRRLHNKLHEQGHYHDHTPATDHPEHWGK
jgi:hypothetical protein